ncbi:MAG: hypothetical protein KatS3mg102_1996 [Planctomycetota bacterium]|nr:MAG: hypothetical protein KatS3mg102_1996 [Planctomycetota bacterium]
MRDHRAPSGAGQRAVPGGADTRQRQRRACRGAAVVAVVAVVVVVTHAVATTPARAGDPAPPAGGPAAPVAETPQAQAVVPAWPPEHVHDPGCGHFFYDGQWHLFPRGHEHGPGCGHYLVGGSWSYFPSAHLHGPDCGHFYYGGSWHLFPRGHVHGPGCGHFYWRGAWHLFPEGHRHGAGCGHVFADGDWRPVPEPGERGWAAFREVAEGGLPPGLEAVEPLLAAGDGAEAGAGTPEVAEPEPGADPFAEGALLWQRARLQRLVAPAAPGPEDRVGSSAPQRAAAAGEEAPASHGVGAFAEPVFSGAVIGGVFAPGGIAHTLVRPAAPVRVVIPGQRLPDPATVVRGLPRLVPAPGDLPRDRRWPRERGFVRERPWPGERLVDHRGWPGGGEATRLERFSAARHRLGR